MNYIRSCWDNVDTELVVRKVSDLYGNLKEEVSTVIVFYSEIICPIIKLLYVF